MADKVDGRSKRIGGMKICEDCGKSFEAFRAWGKYCSHACGRKVRLARFYKKKYAAAAELK